MPFDIEGARKAGYTDAEIADHLGQERKFDVAGARKSGYDDTEIVKHLSMQPTPKPEKTSVSGSVDKIGSAVNTIAEPLVSLATGTAGQVLGGIAGGAAALTPGLRPGIGKEVVEKVSNALTYQPRSEGGKAVMAGIAKPFEWLAGKAGQAGHSTLEATGSPTLATAVDTGIQALPMLAGGVLSRSGAGAESAASIASRTAKKSMNSVKDDTLAAARAEGYVVPPSAIQGSFVGNRLEGIGGKAAIGQEAAIKNQAVTNKIARRESGLAEDAPLSEKTLADARDVLAQPYRDVAAVSPRAASALEKLKETRAEATTYWNHFNRSGEPKSLSEAKALDGKADMLEKVIDKEAAKAGSPDLVDQLRDARTKLAKNYDVERALNVGSGDVDARAIGRVLDRKGENRMSGGLQTVGKFAEAFGPYAREASGIPTPGVSKMEGVASAMLGLGGHAALGPPGWLAAALPLASGPARALMLSKTMQKPRTYERGKLSFAREEAARKAGILGLMGTANND